MLLVIYKIFLQILDEGKAKDSKGNIIYIPRYRKEFKDDHKSIMHISLK